MSALSEQVKAFHRAYGQPVCDVPKVPADDRVRLRLRLIAEEFFELLESASSVADSSLLNMLGDVKRNTAYWINNVMIHVDLPEFVDALADLDYVIEGSRLEFGVDGEPVAAEVHRSNLSKLGADGKAVCRPDGKVTKGPSFSPPDIESVLVAQGWKP